MKCPWCDFDEPPRSLHAHLGEEHGEQIRTEKRSRSRVYVVECPECGAVHEQPIKPRSTDPSFLEEFEAEIRLVGFDMLVNHLMAEHGHG
jgi:hypothetical protein